MDEDVQHKQMKLIVIVLVIAIICESVIFGFVILSENEVHIDYEHTLPFNGWDKNTTVLGDEEAYFYIQDWDDWNEIFLKEPDYDSSVDFAPDFDNYAYAIAYWGWKSSTAYEINITDIVIEDCTPTWDGEINKQLNIIVDKKSYAWGGMMITYPIDFIQIPKDQILKYEINQAIFTIPYY